jgi:hypothetical protein
MVKLKKAERISFHLFIINDIAGNAPQVSNESDEKQARNSNSFAIAKEMSYS